MPDYRNYQQGQSENSDRNGNGNQQQQNRNRRRGEDGNYEQDYRDSNQYSSGESYDTNRDTNRRFSGNEYGNMGNTYERNDENSSKNYGMGGNYGNTHDVEHYGNGSNSPLGNPRGGDQGSMQRRNDNSNMGWGMQRSEKSGGSRQEQNQSQKGLHSGKGPRGYQRTDERITEEVNDCLADDGFIDATEIEISVSAGEVSLTGTVDTREAKRRAEDICESISGVKNVENRLRVKQTSASGNDDENGSRMSAGQMSRKPETPKSK